jgi:hypothetical protein
MAGLTMSVVDMEILAPSVLIMRCMKDVRFQLAAAETLPPTIDPSVTKEAMGWEVLNGANT